MNQKVQGAVINLLRSLVNNKVGDLHRDDDVQDEVRGNFIRAVDVVDMDPETFVDDLLKDEDIQALCKRMVRDILHMVKDVAKEDIVDD